MFKDGLNETKDGRKKWFLNGKYHREDGPAYISELLQSWWFEGKRHRTDGPAVEYIGSGSFKEWWYHGVKIDCSSQQQFEKLIKMKAFW